jgi:hypothetical protein
VKKAELAAAVFAARETALKTLKEQQSQLVQEINMKEVVEKRTKALAMADAREEEEQRQKSQNKTKMGDRLAAKRAKKEKEMKELEEQQLAELQRTQQLEAETKRAEAEKKMLWSDRVKMVLQKAKELNYSFIEAEDYAYRETLEKKLVPPSQLTEAVQMIQRERHNSEMSQLLNKNFAERRALLESRMKEVMNEKALARMQIMEKFSKDEGRLAPALKQFEEAYANKPLETEQRVFSELEPEHTRMHMDLKQRQLDEIAKIVQLYSGGRTLQAGDAGGKTQEEELREYQARLQAERANREEELQRQRQEAEARLRAENEAALENLQKDLARKKREADEQVKKEHEELMKQKNESLEVANKEQKERILENFDKLNQDNLKRMEEDRLKKRSKMEERLRRKTQAATANAPTTEPSPELVNASAAVTFGTEAQNTAQVAAIQARVRPAMQQQPLMMAPMMNLDAILPAVTSQMQTIDEKLRRIEMLISANETKLSAAPVSAAAAAPVSSRPPLSSYHDPEPPAPGERREVVSDNDLSSPEFARVDFGRRLVSLVLGKLSTLKVNVAASLPPSTAVGNAFASSYDYSKGANELLIHKDKLKTSGDFGLVVIHALSHIKVSKDIFTKVLL